MDPNNRVLGLKYHSINGLWALKPYELNPWTLMDCDTLYIICRRYCCLDERLDEHARITVKLGRPNLEDKNISERKQTAHGIWPKSRFRKWGTCMGFPLWSGCSFEDVYSQCFFLFSKDP